MSTQNGGSSAMRAYPRAVFDPPVRLPQLDSWHWRRKFRCPHPDCAHDREEAGQRGRRVIGWQQVRKWMHQGGSVRPDAPVVPPIVGYMVEKVWLARELTDLPDLPDGTLGFGLPAAARDQSFPSSRPRAVPVLASAGPTPFGPLSGDPYRAGRQDRVRGGTGYWSIALTGEKARRPFVVTCPDCHERCLVDGALPEDELRRLDEPSA